MARDKCDPVLLLTAIQNRLRSQLSLNEAACFISLTPRTKLQSPADLTVIITPMGGPFDGAMIDGGGQQQVTVNAGVAITIRSYLQADEAGHDYSTLIHHSLGVMNMATGVLKALTVWDPLDNEGDAMLRDQMSPASFDYAKESRSDMICELQFNTLFDWDLDAYPGTSTTTTSTTTTTTTTAAP